MKQKSRNSKIDNIQKNQYHFPYHFIPDVSNFPNFSKQWSFAPSYIAAINLTINWLQALGRRQVHTHMDFGCGDGAFLLTLKEQKQFHDIRFLGIDLDENAINWARLFGHTSKMFSVEDVKNINANSIDSGTLIEVLEHIPVEDLDEFITNVARSLKIGAELFITVPSTQKKVTDKHYQHFTHESLKCYLEDKFEIISMKSFDKMSFFTKILKRITRNNWYIFESRVTNKLLIHLAQKTFSKEKGCGRHCVLVRKVAHDS